MLKSFFRWLWRSAPEPIKGETIYESLINQLGDINELATKRFMSPKARMVKLTVVSKDLDMLSERLIDASVVVSKADHFSGAWSDPLIYRATDLETFISDGDHLIHPIDWVREHHHYIIKLLDAFMQLDEADSVYYQRKCNFVIEDILALVIASRQCIR
ncbi:hypothetical protein D9M68_17410 [compost metagenome]